jgi:hypothetical protein
MARKIVVTAIATAVMCVAVGVGSASASPVRRHAQLRSDLDAAGRHQRNLLGR